MIAAKHTSGPWSATRVHPDGAAAYVHSDADDEEVCVVYSHRRDDDAEALEQAKADARLIAKATGNGKSSASTAESSDETTMARG